MWCFLGDGFRGGSEVSGTTQVYPFISAQCTVAARSIRLCVYYTICNKHLHVILYECCVRLLCCILCADQRVQF